jgi:oxidase EvaA
MDELQQRITAEKFECEIDSRIIPLNDVTQWRKTESEILHEEGKFFSVIAVRVEADDREVESWDQPIIQQHQPGLVGFMTRRIDGVTHFLTQLKMESGVMDLLEVAPTVQCITGSYEVENRPRFVDDFLNAVPGDTVLDVMQSEEGGRFFHESNRNVILHDEEKADLEVPRYTWMSLYQLKWLLNLNNFLNVEARSLLACLRMH